MPRVLSGKTNEPVYKKRVVPAAKIFIPESMISLMTEHADAGFDTEHEVMGLMIGTFYRDENGQYAVVDRVATTDLIADMYSVKFNRDSLDKMCDTMDIGKDESIVGWYHSHLDLGCFMSPTDISTQDRIFNGDCGFALVIDPVRKEMKIFDSTPGNPQPVDMIVLDND